MIGSYVLHLARNQVLASPCRLNPWNRPVHFNAKFLFVHEQSRHVPLAQISRVAFARHYSTQPQPKERSSIFSRTLPSALQSGPATGSSLRKVISLAKPEKKPLLFAVFLLLVSSSVAMSVPFTIGKLIDYFSTENPKIPFGLTTWQASGILLLAFTTGAVCNAGRSFLMRMSGQRIVARLRENMYGAALRQEVEFVEKGEGDVLSRLGADSSIVGESVTNNLSDGLRAIVMSSVGLGAMFYLSPKLTLLMLGIVPPVSLGAVWYGRYLRKLSNQTQEAMGEMTKVAQESLSGLRTVQAFNGHAQEQQKFHEQVTNVLNLVRKEAIASGIFFGSTGWSGNVTMLGLLGYGGTLVAQGAITVGDLTSLLLYTVYVGSGLQMLSITSIMRGIGAGTRIFEILDRKPAIPPNQGIELDPSRRGVVKFENVGFEYPSRRGVVILDNFNLEVAVGESVAIVGRSGGGKSSVQSLLLRFYDPVRGKVTFDGQDIREFNPNSWRNIIGIVPQDPKRPAREANCDFVWGMPKGFDTEIGRSSLSGGQRQHATSEHRVNDAIDKILRDRQTTCLIVAHRLSTIARAERIVVLEDGRITESGTYRELVGRKDSRFRVLMAAQLGAAEAGLAPESL
ncbi:ABC transporter type 1, transmembrane domain-containing protein [Pisolithus orientalis]|uniref:ABC transporter type 1, transmembrane domain-containing protein n=1 Tax=Pisolithus orientalis TaxID=936130 RepID=UPI00222554C7|nr:ABC transporter type 1, transmembrane domain-containing protein [Pisolithus orientalis]KAI6007575.1 ABC transporter type 1, transmembrane domain-containing protein [Pisolithus orientalis]